MINIYTKNNQVIKYTENDDIETLDAASILWIDLLNPSAAEISKIGDGFEVEFPTRQERESIESSSRYWEDSDSISINALFFVSFFFADKAKDHCNESVAFIIKNEILFTMRYKELKSFNETQRRLLRANSDMGSGYDIFMHIFDNRIEADAALIEYAAKEINKLRKDIFSPNSKMSDDEILERISTIQEFNLKIRETISDKRRITIGLLKSGKISKKHRDDLTIMIKV